MNALRKIGNFILISLIWCLVIFVFTEIGMRVYSYFNPTSLSAVGTKIFRADPHNTYAHKPFAEDSNGYGDPTPKIYINNLGLRDQNFIPEKHTKNILMLGDSFTFGTGLANKDIFPEKLQRTLQKNETGNKNLGNLDRWQVWNAGVIGYSIDNYLISLKKLTPKIHPDLVIVNIFVANDITELRRREWDRNERNELVRVRDQKLRVNFENQLVNRAQGKPLSYFAHFLAQRWQILQLKLGKIDPRSHEPTLTWPVFLAIDHPGSDLRINKFWKRFFIVMDEMQDYSEKRNMPIVFNLIPMDVQISEAYESKYAHKYFDNEARKADRPQTKIMLHCAERNITCWNPIASFRQHPKKEELYFSHNADPHLDTLGHQVLAEFIYKKISPTLFGRK